jgi:hypothetical protein
MGTVLVQYWQMDCVSCGWHQRRMVAGSLGEYYVKMAAIKQHKVEAGNCTTGDVGVEVRRD